MGKYDGVIGHKDIVNNLANAVDSGKIGHAYMFGGPEGVGKATLARIFAQILLCVKPQPDGSCGVCHSCKQFSSGNNPNFKCVVPDGKSIKISQIRQIKSEVSLNPFQDVRRVYIIEEAHTMTREAANSFLKVLEEPPGNDIFILVTDNPYSILTTISSRCQQFKFKPLTVYQLFHGLKKLRGLDEKDCRYIVRLAGGSLGLALELAKNENRDQLPSLLRKLDEATDARICLLVQEIVNREFNLQRLMDMLMLWYRDILMWKKIKNKELVINTDMIEKINLEADKLTVHKLLQNMKAINKARLKLLQKVNNRLVMEELFFSLARR